jgi:hypothetical protein
MVLMAGLGFLQVMVQLEGRRAQLGKRPFVEPEATSYDQAHV